MASLIDHFPYLGIFLLLALGDLGLPFPEDTTLILSGFDITEGYKPLPTFLVIYPTFIDRFLSLFGLRNIRKVMKTKDSVGLYLLRDSQNSKKYSGNGVSSSYCWKAFSIRAQVFLRRVVRSLP
jgi:hypothetical protein